MGDLTDLVHSLPFINIYKAMHCNYNTIYVLYWYLLIFFIMYRSLQKLVQDADSWDLQLDPALFGILQAISRTTKYSPFQIAYVRSPTLPAEMKLKEMETPKEATEDIVENLMKYRKTLHDIVEENIKDAQTKMKEDHGRKVAAKNSFAPRDIVYTRNCQKLQRKQSKLKELNWIGPYTISDVSSKGVATLMDRSGTVLKLKCRVGNLKLKRRRPRHLMDRVKKPSPVMTVSTEETQENEHQSDSECLLRWCNMKFSQMKTRLLRDHHHQFCQIGPCRESEED